MYLGVAEEGGLVFTSWQAKFLYESESSDPRTTCVLGGCDGLSVIVAPGS